MNADTFNSRYRIGTPVFAYPGARPEDCRNATRLVTRTRTIAQVSNCGTDVVWVEGEGSYISLTHVDPVSESVWQAAKQAEETAAAVAAQGAPPVPVGDQPQPLEELKQVSQEIARFGIYGAAVPATKALVKRADELVTENAELRTRVAELEAERHTTNEALTDAAETLRANRDRIAELEKRSATLAALEAAGVDNWDGYSDALDGDS
ncbi:hypothetical protein ACF09Y_22600 [Streptomyces massasporeus]|uniref:hypothetical protein n=1 Tax=Streptomyces massasporeus TaxID=67324 RepID=UPI003703039A